MLVLSCSSVLLRVVFDAAQLSAPVLREHAAPVVNRAQRLGVGAVEGASAVASDRYQSDIAQNLQMLRHRGLPEPQRVGDLPDRALLGGDQLEDVAPPRFGDRVERIGSGRRARHTRLYIPL